MPNRKPLTAALPVVPPDADPQAVQAFLTQQPGPNEPTNAAQDNRTADDPASTASTKSPRKPRRATKGPVPVGLIPVTVRLKPEVAAALKRASLERQLRGEEPFTQQEIVEHALEPSLRAAGYLM